MSDEATALRTVMDRPLFTDRYGIGRHLDKPDWTRRHRDGDRDTHACRCPGIDMAETDCTQRATQEDILCDACREHCLAVDMHGKYYVIADLPSRSRSPETGKP